jgi:diguanylate cyclase (GGDEF)-like protein
MPWKGEWISQQIAEFLALVSACEDERSAIVSAVERAAEALEAEVAAVILVADAGEPAGQRRVAASVGYPAGCVPEADLLAVAVATGGRGWLAVPGAGDCRTLAVPLDGAGRLLIARSGDEFNHEEAALLRGLGRVLTLVMRTLVVLAEERRLRRQTEAQVEENDRLLAELRERRTLLERLFRIQRSISHRMPIQEVLDSITEGAAELLGDEMASLRIIDEADPGFTLLLSARGLEPDGMAAIRRSEVIQGISGQAITGQHLVIVDDYPAHPAAHEILVAQGVKSAMAAPVSRNGAVVGSLLVASDRHREYSPAEQDVLLAFAEHASLALNDASAVEGMRRAFDSALHQATHDPLTGLPNRALVLDRLGQALARAQRHGGRVTVLFADLDRFKVVNDSLGHGAGDRLLVSVSERLRSAVRAEDTVGRLSGDEFVVICENTSDREAEAVAERAAAAIAEPFVVGGRETVITASIGIAHAEPHTRAEDMLRDSDVAMYRAKERGRARIELFDAAMRLRMFDRLETEHALRTALARHELRLVYQPIVCLDDGRVVAAEALVRWDHPVRGLISPSEFIPVAEESGLVLPLGRYVLNEACHQLARWRAAGRSELRVTVNLSARQFSDPDLLAVVAAALEAAGLPGDALWLEITESVLMEEAESTAETLRALKGLGVHLSVDDFGTGYSSLSYLKRFPVDLLKIDRSFVDGLGTEAEDSAIVNAIISLARALRLGVVAEGVEHPAQLVELHRLGCTAVQGFLLAPPLPADQFPERALSAVVLADPPVADAGLGEDEAGRGRVVAELAP